MVEYLKKRKKRNNNQKKNNKRKKEKRAQRGTSRDGTPKNKNNMRALIGNRRGNRGTNIRFSAPEMLGQCPLLVVIIWAHCCGVVEQPTASPPKWARVYCGFRPGPLLSTCSVVIQLSLPCAVSADIASVSDFCSDTAATDCVLASLMNAVRLCPSN